MVSVIIPIYNEESNLELLHKELVQAIISCKKDFEIIYVDDGSRDNSFGIINNIFLKDNNKIKIIRFSRHYGQTEAMQAGLDFSKGDIIIFMDADLQNDPCDIPKLLSKMEEGYDIVSGWRRKRKDNFFTRRIPSYFANLLISYITKIRLHDYGCSLKAYRREVIKGIKLFSEMHRFIPIYAVKQRGASIVEIEISHRARFSGKSKYSLMRIYKVVLDFLVTEFMNNYLNRPMYIFGIYGIFTFFIGSLSGIIVIVRRVLFGGIWVSPLLFIAIMSVIVSCQFILMGLLAEISIRSYYKISKENIYNIKTVLEKNAKK